MLLELQRSEDDVSQFDTKFTKQIPVDSPEETTLSESANMMFQGFTYVAPSVLEEMSHPSRMLTARSPRRTPRHREDHMGLRVFPGTSTSSIAGISSQPQQFYPNSSHHQNNNTMQPQRHPHPLFAGNPHLQGFSNTPSEDSMMDINIS
jgi:hypothetical protein